MKQEDINNIIHKIKAGDKPAFSELVKRTMNLAQNIASDVLVDSSEIEDAIQETYIKIWNSIFRYDPGKGNFLSWFSRILHNECIDRNRKSKTFIHKELTDNIEYKSSQIDDVLYLNQIKCLILEIGLTLPAKQQEVFQLRDIQGLSIKEVCLKTGMSEGSVKTQLYLARKKIKEDLENHEKENFK